MSHIARIKEVLEILGEDEIQQLIGFLRKRTDIIIPKCFTKKELMRLLLLEGFTQKLSDWEFAQIKQDCDNKCIEIMREYLRTNLMIHHDRTLN
jgi:hypothetical protein